MIGQTTGTYPVSSGVYSNANGSQYIHKLSSDLTTTVFSTVFGTGSSNIDISPTAFLVDDCENIYVSGWGGGNNYYGTVIGMPITTDAFQSTSDGDDLYFLVLERNATSILYGTVYGGLTSNEHVDGGTSRFDKSKVLRGRYG